MCVLISRGTEERAVAAVWLRLVHVRWSFCHKLVHLRRRVQTQTSSDSLSTVKVKVFINSELWSICGYYLFATCMLQLHSLQTSLSPPFSGTAVVISWHFRGDKPLHEIQPCHVSDHQLLRVIIWRSNIAESCDIVGGNNRSSI